MRFLDQFAADVEQAGPEADLRSVLRRLAAADAAVAKALLSSLDEAAGAQPARAFKLKSVHCVDAGRLGGEPFKRDKGEGRGEREEGREESGRRCGQGSA